MHLLCGDLEPSGRAVRRGRSERERAHTVNHRVADGRLGSDFLTRFMDMLEGDERRKS